MSDSALERILCPYDFSDASRVALRWSGSLAQALGGAVTVLHAEPPVAPFEFTPDMVAALAAGLEAARQYATDQAVAEVQEIMPPGVAYDVQVSGQVPAEAIVAKAGQVGANLIVMGTHEHGAIHRLLAGSVTEEVVRRVACPVFIARDGEGLPRLERILCPVNRTPVAKHLLATAAAYARAFGAELLILHAMDPHDEDRAAGRQDEAEAICAEVAAEAGDGCPYRAITAPGNAAEQIVRAAREEKVSLTLVGARLRPFLDATVIGSTTERVMRHAPSSVLVVPERAAGGSA
jgi:nucleotide-binding universal stress UspA family protein